MSTTVERLANTPPVSFWVLKKGATAIEPGGAISPEALQKAIDNGLECQVCKMGESEWKSPSVFGFVKTITVASAPPPPPATPATPAADPLSAAMAAQSAVSAPAGTPPPPNAIVVANQPAASTAVAVTSRELPSLVKDDTAADAVLKALCLPVGANQRSLSSIVDAVAGSGGVSFALPWSTLKDNGWDTNRDYVSPEIYMAMPSGKREFAAIFLALRVGATGWVGAGSAGSGGQPPIWRFALPHLQANPDSEALVERTMSVASLIQFTGGADRVKYDGIGRLSPELHILVWTRQTGFALLVVNGFTAVRETLHAFRDPVNVEGEGVTKPILFTCAASEQVNKRVMKEDPNAKNAAWNAPYVLPKLVPADDKIFSPIVFQLLTEWQTSWATARVQMANTIQAFLTGADFEGLALPEVKALLLRYEPFLEAKKAARANKG
jgi:hypothetical protein